MHSADGVHWSEWQRLAAFGEGHYQISASAKGLAATAFNYHPPTVEGGVPGLNYRTNLYYLQTTDNGASWTNARGEPIEVPLLNKDNEAMVRDYEKEDLLVYMKDILIDAEGRPVILYITSKGYASGPQNAPRTWTLAKWTGEEWRFHTIATSDNNYDMGSLHIADGKWMLMAPVAEGPQPYNPGGEMAMYVSTDEGATWKMKKQMTKESERNHTYARRPVHAHRDFYAFWADGNGRAPSESRLYFSDHKGRVFQLPAEMSEDFQKPTRVK